MPPASSGAVTHTVPVDTAQVGCVTFKLGAPGVEGWADSVPVVARLSHILI